MSATTLAEALEALRAVLPYAESRAEDMSECAAQLPDQVKPGITIGFDIAQAEARDLADKAWQSVQHAQSVLADAVPGAQPIDPPWRCTECKGLDVEESAWRNINTGEVTSSGGDGPVSHFFCDTCEDECRIEQVPSPCGAFDGLDGDGRHKPCAGERLAGMPWCEKHRTAGAAEKVRP